MKEKYAEQDEEEREMLLQMLGSRKVKGMDYSDTAVKENISNNEPMEVEEEDQQDAQEEPKSDQEEFQEQIAEEDQEDQEITDQVEEDATKKVEEDEEEKKEIEHLMKEEDINVLPENVDVSEIDKLTGVPKAKGKFCQ